MDTNALKKFAQEARIVLHSKVKSKIDLVLDEQSAARRENPKAVKDLENNIHSTIRPGAITSKSAFCSLPPPLCSPASAAPHPNLHSFLSYVHSSPLTSAILPYCRAHTL